MVGAFIRHVTTHPSAELAGGTGLVLVDVAGCERRLRVQTVGKSPIELDDQWAAVPDTKDDSSFGQLPAIVFGPVCLGRQSLEEFWPRLAEDAPPPRLTAETLSAGRRRAATERRPARMPGRSDGSWAVALTTAAPMEACEDLHTF